MKTVAVIYDGKQTHYCVEPTDAEWQQATWVLLPNGSYTGRKHPLKERRKALKRAVR